LHISLALASASGYASTSSTTWRRRLTILEQLTSAEGIERYLHTRYVGQKRFSLEGGDSLIPMLDDLIHQGGAAGIHEIVIGMAHRGRINVLVNILGKSPEELFEEFEGNYDLEELKGSGDVKYHKGFSADMKTTGGNVHIALAFNPSHLEIVNPVVEGSVRARQQRRHDWERLEVLPVLIHGDAAFSGQGVVTETFQLSQTNGFRTGGTVHIVVNNQIGFTTSRPSDARSTDYCSDVAKMIEAPIFHVNGDDPEAAILVTRLALQYRQRFKKDVVIDLVCYRRHGHNEADEPAATQPVMYTHIRSHRTTRELYAERLVEKKLVSNDGARKLQDDYRDRLDRGEPVPEASLGMIGNEFTVDWTPYLDAMWDEPVDTTVSPGRAGKASKSFTELPGDLKLHGRVQRIVDERARMAAGEIAMDWGFAETMAYATLIEDGYDCRLVGQDSGRGTFFHRHASRHRFPAVGRSGARLRIRLCDDGAEHARHLGGPVRRLRERRTGGHRSVHQFRRREVGTLVRHHSLPAARLRRAGSGTFVCAARAIPAALCRTQHAGLRAVHSSANVPYVAPTDAAQVPQAADRYDAQEPVAAQDVGVADFGVVGWPLQPDHPRNRGDRACRDTACRILQRQGLLRPARGSPGARDQ
jgi:hypothetical protein